MDDIEADDTEVDDTEINDIEIDDYITNDFVLDEISRMLKILNLPNSMGVKEFLNISEENIVYEFPEDIMKFIEIFKKKYENTDEVNDSTEMVTISTNQ